MSESIPLPAGLASELSRRAAEIAKDLAPRDTGRGAASIMPESSEGYIGLTMLDYMKVQDQGFEPRLMTELAGKVVPIREASGRMIFRTANPESIGRSKIIARDAKGRPTIIKKMWQHPGLEPKSFVQKSISQAITEWAASASSADIIRTLEESQIDFLIRTIKGQE